MTYPSDLVQYGVIAQSIVRDTYHSFFTEPLNSADNKIGACYYDVMETGDKLKTFFGDAGFDNIINDGATWYRDEYVIANGGRIPSWQAFTTGLLSHFQSGASGYLTSKFALDLVAQNSSYAVASGPADLELQDFYWSRECAYTILAYINNYLAGNSLNPRVTQLKDWSLGHIRQWRGIDPVFLSGHSLYYRPFMHWLTTYSLIEYYKHVSADPAILQVIIDSTDWQWTTYWRSGDTYPSFNYTSVDTSAFDAHADVTHPGGIWFNTARNAYEDYPGYNSGGTESSNDLNLMGVAVYGWLWTQTFDTKWITRADEMWRGGMPFYDNTNHWQHGAYLGGVTSTGVKGKSCNQCFKWSHEYPAQRNVTALPTPPPVGSGPFSTRYNVVSAANATLDQLANAVDDLLVSRAYIASVVYVLTNSTTMKTMFETVVTLTVGQGEVVRIEGVGSFSHSLANSEVQIAIGRNGVQVFNGISGFSYRSSSAGSDFCLKASAIDAPSPGTYTYSLMWNVFAGNAYSSRQQIVAIVLQNN